MKPNLIGSQSTDPLVITLINMFQDERYGYKVLYSSVVVNTFYALYNRLIISEVAPLELLDVSIKTKYWEIAKMFYTDKEKAIRASKAAYILYTITSGE